MKAQAVRRAMKLSEIAETMGVTPAYIKKNWIDAGHLPAFVPPGVELVSPKTGPKNLRVWSDDWERFADAQTKVARTTPQDEPQGSKVTSPVRPEVNGAVELVRHRKPKRGPR